MSRGAWEGKVLGAGGAGCLMMLVPLGRRAAVVEAMMAGAKAEGFEGACEVPVAFVQAGAEIVTNSYGKSIAMEQFIYEFAEKAVTLLRSLPKVEIAKAMNILQATFERDGRIYVIGNGGSLALATHWVADFNKTVFSHNLDEHQHRFQAIRLPTTEEELTAWANDVGYYMVFAGPLRNYIQDSDVLIAISSSGNSENIIRAVEAGSLSEGPGHRDLWV